MMIYISVDSPDPFGALGNTQWKKKIALYGTTDETNRVVD